MRRLRSQQSRSAQQQHDDAYATVDGELARKIFGHRRQNGVVARMGPALFCVCVCVQVFQGCSFFSIVVVVVVVDDVVVAAALSGFLFL